MLLSRSLSHPPRSASMPAGKMEGSVSSVLSKSCTLFFGLLGMRPRASDIMLAKCLPRGSFPQCPFLSQEGESRKSRESHSPWPWPTLAWGLWVSVRTGAKRQV